MYLRASTGQCGLICKATLSSTALSSFPPGAWALSPVPRPHMATREEIQGLPKGTDVSKCWLGRTLCYLWIPAFTSYLTCKNFSLVFISSTEVAYWNEFLPQQSTLHLLSKMDIYVYIFPKCKHISKMKITPNYINSERWFCLWCILINVNNPLPHTTT